MFKICNKEGRLAAYLVKNILVTPENNDAIGVILGNCVYNKQGRYVGVAIHHRIFNQQGETLGTLLLHEHMQESNNSKIVNAGWTIVEQIKDHTSCSWIEDKQQWANNSFEEIFA